MTGKVIPFNPLDKQNLGASVAEALLSKDAHPLEELRKVRISRSFLPKLTR